MAASVPSGPKGRGSHLKPPNRFDRIQVEEEFEETGPQDDEGGSSTIPTVYLADESRTVVSENNSPDVSFRYSLNPYRGCLHGCSYCYARPTHEYLGLNAGIDFESQIYVKHRAAELFREFLSRPAWVPEVVVFSGVTDCYQPAERQFRRTRQCLEVAAEFRQPVSIITKNALVTRDLDLLQTLAQQALVHVNISITSLDPQLARVMEPRTSSPEARLRAVTRLRDAGIPVNVMVAPVIPGLNDSEIPGILKAAREAGALSARYVLLRLPLTVRPVFQEWLERTQPSRRELVESRIRACRDGELNSARFGERMRGTGPLADQIQQTFTVFQRKLGLDGSLPPLDSSRFEVPLPTRGQLRLF